LLDAENEQTWAYVKEGRFKSGTNGSGQLCAGNIVCIDKSSSAELTKAINSMFQ